MGKIDYKETLIGPLPMEWEVDVLKNIAKVKGGKRVPKEDGLVDFETSFPYIRVVDLKDGRIERSNVKYLTPETYKKISKYTISSDDVCISIAGTVGIVSLIPPELDGANLTENAAKLYGLEKVTKEFLAYTLNSNLLTPQIKSHTGVGTQPKLALSRLKKLLIPLPPLSEQKKIVEILSTVDRAIQKVDNAIAKTERLKKGLIQELLTKGIGHEEYKDTEIGKIPTAWKLATLGDRDLINLNEESRDPTKKPNEKFEYIDIESVENGTGQIRDTQTILGENAPSRARRVVHQDDVIMSTVRPYLKAFALISNDLDGQICSTGFAVLTCKENLNPNYLLYTLFSDIVISQCNQMMAGGQYPALRNSQVARIKIPLPPLTEQKKIAQILHTVDKKLELERERKEKLERVKKGLMQDLLTGKVRVNVDGEDVEAV